MRCDVISLQYNNNSNNKHCNGDDEQIIKMSEFVVTMN